MATIDLGKIKFVNKGAYNNSTAYTPDDVVTSSGSSYICKLASTGNAVTNGTYWDVLAAAGTNGTDVGTTITTQGDILYRDGSGLQRLAKGTAGQALKMNSGANAPEWGTIASNYEYISTGSFSSSSAVDIDGSTKWGTGYDIHRMLLEFVVVGTNNANINLQQLTSGSPQSANHSWGNIRFNSNNAGPHVVIGENDSQMQISGDSFRGTAGTAYHAVEINFTNMTKTTTANHYLQMWGQHSGINHDGDQRLHGTSFWGAYHSNHSTNQNRTGIRVYPNSGSITGTYKIWGIKS